MKEVMIQGVAMIPASEVYKELERLTASRAFWRQAAAVNGTRANDYEAQLDAIREALHGAPDCDLVALAREMYTCYEMHQQMTADAVTSAVFDTRDDVVTRAVMKRLLRVGND